MMYNQLNGHDPENGIFGDCFRTCVANLLGIHPSGVPEPESLNSVVEPVKRFLIENNLDLFWFAFDHSLKNGKPQVHFSENHKFQDIPYILNGRNFPEGHNHSCLYLNGKLLHDPSGRDGLHYPMIEDGEEFWAIYVIVPLLTPGSPLLELNNAS